MTPTSNLSAWLNMGCRKELLQYLWLPGNQMNVEYFIILQCLQLLWAWLLLLPPTAQGEPADNLLWLHQPFLSPKDVCQLWPPKASGISNGQETREAKQRERASDYETWCVRKVVFQVQTLIPFPEGVCWFWEKVPNRWNEDKDISWIQCWAFTLTCMNSLDSHPLTERLITLWCQIYVPLRG